MIVRQVVDLMGRGDKNAIVKVEKQYNTNIAAISNGLTSTTNNLYQVLTYRTNIANINESIQTAQLNRTAENKLETDAAGGGGASTSLAAIDEVAAAVEDLNRKMEENAERTSALQKLLGTIALVGATALTIFNTGSDSSTPSPPPPAPTPNTPPPTSSAGGGYFGPLRSLFGGLFGSDETIAPSPSGQTRARGGGGYGGRARGRALPAVGQGDAWIMNMIRGHEGSIYSIYKDSRGYPTFGVGHLITRNDPEYGKPIGTAVSRDRVESVFAQDYAKHKKIAEGTPGWDKANAAQRGAMVDLAFNMGEWWKSWPNTSAALEKGDWQAAAVGLRNSAWYNQVGRRAETIIGLISSGNVSTALQQGNVRTSSRAATNNNNTVINSANITAMTQGKNIWDYARRNGSDVDWDGLNSGMKQRFLAMAMEYHEKTGNKVAINSANRTYAKQAFLYRTMPRGKAARPGTSRHESGMAIDINTPDAEAMISLGLFEKYGFHRPVRGETWHIEPIESKGQAVLPDNPYAEGEPIAQTGRSGAPLIQDGQGRTRPITDPQRQLSAASTNVTIAKAAMSDKEVILVPVGGGQSPQNPLPYLTGIKAPKPPKGVKINPAKQYREYFAA